MDMYGLGMSGLPPEYQAQYRALQQQQMIAQSMLAQSQDPLANQAPGVAVSPFQGLAKVAQAYIGAKGMQNANKAYQGIGEKYTADQNSAIAKVQQGMAPRTLPDASAGPPATMQRTPEERRAVVQEAMLSQFPNVRNFGTTLNSNMQADQTREDNQLFRTQEAQLTREQRQHERDLAVEERKRQEIIAEQVRQQQFQQQKEMKELVAKQGSSPFFNFLPTADGYMVGNARTGQMSPSMVNGKPVMKATDSPELQGQIAGAKAGGKELGEAGAKAKLDLPTTIDKASLASKQIDDLLTHPGFSSTVGATLRPGARLVDGTHEADFMKRLDQLQGGAFLQAFESLKGGGQITEVEGKKATEAIARMNKSQSEKEFTTAAREFQGFINKGVERAKVKAGGTAKAPAVSVESLLEKYK